MEKSILLPLAPSLADPISKRGEEGHSSSILTLLESVSDDFELKNGIRGSELTTVGYSRLVGVSERDEGLQKEVPFIVDFDRIGVCFRRF